MKRMTLAALLVAGVPAAALAQDAVVDSTVVTTDPVLAQDSAVVVDADPTPGQDAAVVVATDPVLAQETTVVVGADPVLARQFEIEREIVDRAQAIWGEGAAFETPDAMSDAVVDQIVAGEPMPAAVPVGPVPEALGDLPELIPGGRWVASGNHLIELAPDNTVAMAVYDALP